MVWLYFQLVLARAKRERASLSPLICLAGLFVKRKGCAHVWSHTLASPAIAKQDLEYPDSLTGLPILLPGHSHQYRSSPRGYSEGAIGRRSIGNIFGTHPTCSNASATAVQLYSVISHVPTLSHI